MRDRVRILIALLAVLAIAALAGCGSDEESTGATGGGGTAAQGESTGADEGSSATGSDDPAQLPKGWKTSVNKAAGFSIGLPPGWRSTPTEGGQGSIVVSPDDLITLTITADRTSGALALPLEEFASPTAEALGSDVVGKDRFEDLVVSKAAPFNIGHGYEAAGVRATGTSARTGVKELIFVVVVRRPDDAAYVVISRENAKRQSQVATRDDVKSIIRSLRGRRPAD